jgi:signal transduction histidine kinase/CheY-like chemotaxis protein
MKEYHPAAPKNKPITYIKLQLMSVVLAFVLMIAAASIFADMILREHLRREALDYITQTQLEMNADLTEPKTILTIVSQTIRSMILSGAGHDKVRQYIQEVSAEIRNTKGIGFMFEGIYGYFDVYGGLFLQTEGLIHDKNYDPASRLWYKTAMTSTGDELAVTPIYMDEYQNEYAMTYVQRIFDKQGRPLATVCLNVPVARLVRYVTEMHLTEGSYGVLHDEHLNILYHPDPNLIGKNSLETGGGISSMADEVLAGTDLIERETTNYKGVPSITFSKRLENGCVLYVVTPKAEYFAEMPQMIWTLGILGAILASLLIAGLMRINLARQRLAEEKQRKDVVLANIEKLHEADERMRMIFDTTPLSCELWDKNHIIIQCNKEMLTIFEIPNLEELNRRFWELSPKVQPNGKSSPEMAREAIDKAFVEGYNHFEWMHRKLNGEPIPVDVTLVRLQYRDDYVVAGYCRDLREQKAMLAEIEENENEIRRARDIAEENSQAKSKFLATMSHEIRTPMNVILGITDGQLLNEGLPAEVREAFEKIYNSGDLLLHIINDILDLSKIEAGKLDLNPAQYEMLSLINDTSNMNFMQYGHKQIEFKLGVDENLPQEAIGDELRIKQILNNLLSNAYKYTNEGEILLSFGAEHGESPDNFTLQITVSDTGQGMSPEQIQKMYDEYARFNMEANRTIGGTGLGMSITKNLVKLMGGRITVTSTPGKGSTFVISMPQKKVSPAVLGREAAGKLQMFHFNNTAFERKTKIVREPMPYGSVLIVDDMKSNLEVAKLLMTPYQIHVYTAESGLEALAIVKSGMAFDVIFMDHMMPGMDGIETVSKIRELGYTGTIVALTANAVAGQQDVFLANGFDGYISKPIDIRQLNGALNKFIRDKHRDQEKTPGTQRATDAAAAGPAVKAAQAAVKIGIVIPGVDTKKGLRLYDDEPDYYIPVLRAYVPNALSLIEKLASVSRETLAAYTINIHGLKGISAGIGAESLREKALRLELSAQSGNLAEVLAGNGALLGEAREVASAVQAWLAALGGGSEAADDLPELPADEALELLKTLEPMLENGNTECLEAVEKIRAIPGSGMLREQMENMDFPQALSTLIDLERSLEKK